MNQKYHKNFAIKHLKEKGGFTLLEVILAISILTVGLLAVASMQISAIQGNDRSRGVTESSDRLQDRIEELLAVNYNNLADGTGTNAGNAGLDDLPPDTPDGQSSYLGYQLYWNVADNWAGGTAVTGVKTIRVYVRWQDRGVQSEQTFDFMRTII